MDVFVSVCKLETVFFAFKLLQKKKKIKKLGGKKLCSLCFYSVCMNFDIDIYMWIAQNGIFYFFEFLLIFGVIPLFIFYYFLFVKAASRPIMKINTPNWSLRLVEYIIRYNYYYAY